MPHNGGKLSWKVQNSKSIVCHPGGGGICFWNDPIKVGELFWFVLFRPNSTETSHSNGPKHVWCKVSVCMEQHDHNKKKTEQNPKTLTRGIISPIDGIKIIPQLEWMDSVNGRSIAGISRRSTCVWKARAQQCCRAPAPCLLAIIKPNIRPAQWWWWCGVRSCIPPLSCFVSSPAPVALVCQFVCFYLRYLITKHTPTHTQTRRGGAGGT